MHMKHVFHNRFRMLMPIAGVPEKWDPGPRTSTGETSRCLGGTRDLGAQKWHLELPIFYSFHGLFYT